MGEFTKAKLSGICLEFPLFDRLYLCLNKINQQICEFGTGIDRISKLQIQSRELLSKILNGFGDRVRNST